MLPFCQIYHINLAVAVELTGWRGSRERGGKEQEKSRKSQARLCSPSLVQPKWLPWPSRCSEQGESVETFSFCHCPWCGYVENPEQCLRALSGSLCSGGSFRFSLWELELGSAALDTPILSSCIWIQHQMLVLSRVSHYPW